MPDSDQLQPDELQRYSGHLLLDRLGEAAQLHFKRSRVLIVGVGGLGSPAALYLAAAGIGILVLADGDEVATANLQRQILYTSASVGYSKVEEARVRLEELNEHVRICISNEFVGAANVAGLVADVDVVLDCTDNDATHRLLNSACFSHRKPLLIGAALGFAGQLQVIDFRDSDASCYACLFPHSGAPPARNCGNSGVIGPLLGVIGSLQALEALKLLANLSTVASGLLAFDSLATQWRRLALERAPDCPVCGARG